MGYGDWIFLGALLLVCAIGGILGFGKVLCVFVLNKYVRIIVAIVVCYMFGGMILGIPFVSQLLKDLAANWEKIEFLTKIRLEIIIYYIALFLITMLVVWILSKIIKGICESKAKPIKVTNKIGGVILFGAFSLAVMLLVFQVIAWVGGDTAASFESTLSADAPAIVRQLYLHNPMRGLIDLINV